MNNVINKFFLWVVLLPLQAYGKMGVNTAHLKAILRTKLVMDDRRPNTMNQVRRKKNKAINLATLGTMLVSALLGFFFLFAFSAGKNYTTHLVIYFSMYIFLLASTLISDFTSVLIDIRDNYIILPKPVNDRTIVVARLLHILIHISKLVVPMSLPGIVYMAIKTGVAGTLVFCFLIILCTLLTVFFINALYILILKITTPQRFQSIISTFQIVFAIMLYSSYQIVPRIINKTQLGNYDITGNKYMWIAPPYWFARAWQAITHTELSHGGVLATALSVLAPVASVYIVIKYFAPAFNQKLSLINNSGAESGENAGGATSQKTIGTKSYINVFAKALCNKGAEKMAFLFCWKMTARSKDFKLKVYPSVGYILVMLVVFYLQMNHKADSVMETTIRFPFIVLGVIYFSSFILLTAISQVLYSDKYKAAWIYYSTPISQPGELITGAFKAIVVKFYIPIVVLAFAAGIFIIGPGIIPNMILALCNELFICLLVAYLTIRELPFSSQQNNNVKAGNFVKAMFTLAIPAIVAFAHFLIYKIWVVVCIFIVMSIILTWLVQGSIKKMSWTKIKIASEE